MRDPGTFTIGFSGITGLSSATMHSKGSAISTFRMFSCRFPMAMHVAAMEWRMMMKSRLMVPGTRCRVLFR